MNKGIALLTSLAALLGIILIILVIYPTQEDLKEEDCLDDLADKICKDAGYSGGFYQIYTAFCFNNKREQKYFKLAVYGTEIKECKK